jgi:hypothetical protein
VTDQAAFVKTVAAGVAEWRRELPRATASEGGIRQCQVAVDAATKLLAIHAGYLIGTPGKLHAFLEGYLPAGTLKDEVASLIRWQSGSTSDTMEFDEAKRIAIAVLESCAEAIETTPPADWEARVPRPVRPIDRFTHEETSVIECIKAEIRAKSPAAQMFLFGSRAAGTNGEFSDWDVLAVCPDADRVLGPSARAAVRRCAPKTDLVWMSQTDWRRQRDDDPVLPWVIDHESIELK